MTSTRLFFLTVAWLALRACVPTVPGQPEKTAKDNTEAAQLNLRLGIEYLRDEELERAKNKLEHASDLDPNLALAHSYLALLNQKLGNQRQAEQLYRRAATLDAEDPVVHNFYGAFLCQTGKFARAEKHFLIAAENVLYQTREAALANAGVCAMDSGDPEKAEDYLRRALQVNPEYADALYQLAVLNHQTNHALQARAFLQRYEDKAELSADGLLLGYKIETALGDLDAAQTYAQQLKRKHPTSRAAKDLVIAERGDLNNETTRQ